MISKYNQKKILRKKILEISQKLDPIYKKRSSKKICELVISSDSFQKSDTIFCFIGMKNEVDTKAIIKKALQYKKTVVVPFIVSKGVMVAKQIMSLENLVKNSFGILEPVEDAKTIEAHQIDFCIVPCLSCSHKGVRLGYGGGYYDRYMQNQDFLKMCVCFEKLTCEEIPKDKFDENIDFLVTEIGMQKF